MNKDARCVARCSAAPVILKPVPLCALHGLEVASEIIPGVLGGSVELARSAAATNRSSGHLTAVSAPPGAVEKSRRRPDRPTKAEARRLAEARLEALRKQGVQWVTPRHFRDLPAIVGRSRPWVYMVLGDLVDEGVLTSDYRGEQAGYRFAA